MSEAHDDALTGPPLFGSLVESRREPRSPLRALTLQIALAVHAIGLAVVVAWTWLQVPPIEPPRTQVDFAAVTPAPPPPPAPPKAAPPQVKPKAEVPLPTDIVEPVEMPDVVDTAPAPELDLSVGVDGGVEGGVAGGILGGVPGGALQESGPYRIGGAASTPVLVHQAAPVYPRMAQTARVQGVVILEALIRKDGSIADIRPLQKASMGLTEAAIEAVRQWRYEPARLHGEPVEFYLEVIVRFKL